MTETSYVNYAINKKILHVGFCEIFVIPPSHKAEKT